MEIYRKFYTAVLSLRYSVEIKGLDILSSDDPKLILPNHISHIDPQIMTLLIYKYTDFVPLAAERFFSIPVIKFFLRRLHAVKIYEPQNIRKDPELLETINSQLIQAFKDKKSALIFPAGTLSDGGVERIRNKQSVYSLMPKLPEDVVIAGVRIKGLWGSMWSKSKNGKRPPFLQTYLFSILLVFLNLIFLVPKRKITIEFVDLTKEAKAHAKEDRQTFNRFLESFYNEQGPEKKTFVRHLFYFPWV